MSELHPFRWQLRPAHRSDATTLTALARVAKASWGYPREWMVDWEAELTITTEYIDVHRVTVACVDDEIVGMCAIEDRESHWMLEHVWISPRVHRRGVGRALVLDALNAARHMRISPVHLVSDPFAENFYTRLGATVIGWIAAPVSGNPERRLALMEFSPST